MHIPCKDITSSLEKSLIAQVDQLKEQGVQPKLTAILVGKSAEQESFVKIKQKKAEKLGIGFELIHIKKRIFLFQDFMNLIKTESEKPENTGIIIQLPLPASLQSDTMYSFIPNRKEIEGHKDKSPFLPPLGSAVLTALKYTFAQDMDADELLLTKDDKEVFSRGLKGKKVVMMGRGATGGLPVGKTLSALGVPYINLSSTTEKDVADGFLKEADVIITAVGKRVIRPGSLKPGVVLLNVGLRRDKTTGELKGDYDEEEIAGIASYYTKTPGGLGPIDVTYLYRNLLEAARLQMSAK